MADKILIVQYARITRRDIARSPELYRTRILAMLERIKVSVRDAVLVNRPSDITEESSVVMIDMMSTDANAPLVFVIDRTADDTEVFRDRTGMTDE